MTIWIVNHYATPPTMSGGTRHFTLARELIRKGHKVTIIASSFRHATLKEPFTWSKGEHTKREVIEGVPFLWLHTPPYGGNSLARLKNTLAFSFQVRLQTFERLDSSGYHHWFQSSSVRGFSRAMPISKAEDTFCI